MKNKYRLNSGQTVEMIRSLIAQGVDKMSVIVRHSDRHYTTEPHLEPFMGLNEKGQQFAFELGKSFPVDMTPVLFSSYFGRCIETAYLIDKGFTAVTGKLLAHNTPHEMLTPFYIKDIHKTMVLMGKTGSDEFILKWFNKEIGDAVILDPKETADQLTDFMIERLHQVGHGQAAVCVTHDWNIFPIRKFKLGLPFTEEDVGYLDAVAFYEKEGKIFAAARDCDPVQVI